MNVITAKRTIYIIYIVSILANVLVFLFAYSQIDRVSLLKDNWLQGSKDDVHSAAELASVERHFGYVGFIHQFKNFIIRADDNYYLDAQRSYKSTKTAINSLMALVTNEQDLHQLQVIDDTIELYKAKLELAKSKQGQLSVKELDRLVKVNDAQAQAALIYLREEILPKLTAQQAKVVDQIDGFRNNTISLAFILVPFFFITTVFSVRIIKSLLTSFREVSMIFDMTPDGILYSDFDGRILKANKAATTILGYSLSELKTLRIEDLIPKTRRGGHVSTRQKFMEHQHSREMGERNSKIEALKKDGTSIEVKISISTRKLNGEMRAVCLFKDITERKQLEQYAKRDHLTALYNRRYFDDALHKEFSRSEREQQPLSLMLIDLDHFKALNDNEGHAVGDVALQTLAEFLVNNTREYDHLARWGGDEFVVLCPDLDVESSLAYAERIRVGFEQLNVPWQEKLTLSIGIATLTKHKHYSVKGLLLAADKAVYGAKKAGRNQVMHSTHVNDWYS